MLPRSLRIYAVSAFAGHAAALAALLARRSWTTSWPSSPWAAAFWRALGSGHGLWCVGHRGALGRGAEA
eukprot:1161993-Alexandrium_andersonii.AAC.1